MRQGRAPHQAGCQAAGRSHASCHGQADPLRLGPIRTEDDAQPMVRFSFVFLVSASLLAPSGVGAARREAPRVPMARARAQILELACQRVYGAEPSVVGYCVEVYRPYLAAHVLKTPFCPRAGALVERLQPCVDALVTVLVVGGYARSTAGLSLPEFNLRQTCSEAQLCGGPFSR